MILLLLLLFSIQDSYLANYNITFGGNATQSERLENVAKFQEVIDATPPGATIYLADDTLDLEFTSGGQLEFRKSLRLEGRGRKRSIIRVFPRDPSYAFRTFYITDGADVTFSNFTLLGPDSVDMQNILSEPEVQGIWGWESGNMILEDVEIGGRFRTSIYNTCLKGSKFKVRNSTISAGELALACYGVPDFVDIQGSVFADILAFHDGQPRGVGVYFHNHVNAHIQETWFKNISLMAVQWWEVGGQDSASFDILEDCRFIVDDSLLLANIWGCNTWSNERTLTEYRNCYFENTAGGVAAMGDVSVIGSRFVKCNVPIDAKRQDININISHSAFVSKGQNPVVWAAFPGVNVNITYSTFANDEPFQYYWVKQSFIALENGSSGKLVNCTLDGAGRQNQGIYLDNAELEIALSTIENMRENAIKVIGGVVIKHHVNEK